MGVASLAGAGRPAAHDSPCPASPGMKKLAVPDRQGDSGPESGDQNPSGFVNGTCAEGPSPGVSAPHQSLAARLASPRESQ